MLQERLPENLKWNDNVAANYHQHNTVDGKLNRKYVSADGCFELIFNANDVLQTQYNNPEDMGTFNYYNPATEKTNHFYYDVIPYGAIPGVLKWGNVPK